MTLTAFPGHAGRGLSLLSWRFVACALERVCR
jgi:hypothetical protein